MQTPPSSLTSRSKRPHGALALLALAVAACSDSSAPGPSPAPSALLVGALDPAAATANSTPMSSLFGRVDTLHFLPDFTVAGSTIGRALIEGARIGPSTVTLASSDPSVATVPASVTVGIDTWFKDFPVTAVAGAAGCPVVSARIGSTPPESAMVYVDPPATSAASSVSLEVPQQYYRTVPRAVAIYSDTGSVRLMLPLNATNNVVLLSSSHPDVVVPSSVGVPLQRVDALRLATGAASFPITVTTRSEPTCAVITASHTAGQSRVLIKVRLARTA